MTTKLDGPEKVDTIKITSKWYLDMWFEVSPCQSMCDTLIDIVQSLLEHSWSHILLLLVLVQNFQQNLVGKILSLLTVELR